MIKQTIQKVIEKENLTFTESHNAMNKIMSGEVNNSQIAALLVALKSKGEHADEVAGFAKAMREKSIKVNSINDSIDVCGTGGDNSNTINISTAAAFVVAGAGIKVAKHGNRSISSKSGSSDVLTELGVNINMTNEASKEALDYWQDVDFYIGGTEHAVGHLMYSRFWHKFLYDLNLVPTNEPFKRLVNQGMIQGVIEFQYSP